MTRILHLSDLHFGCEHRHMVAPLAEALRALEADLIVVSGDLTQRARKSQFQAAQNFLSGLGVRVLAVPGNHDVPLYNLPARLAWPFGGYRHHVARVMTPSMELDGRCILSLNTADPTRWRRGKLRTRELAEAAQLLSEKRRAGPAILVCHHPLVVPPGYRPDETRGRVVEALERLGGLGLGIVLSGHLHHWSIGCGVTEANPQKILHLHAGTALCAREGEGGHGFACLDLSQDRLEVTRHHWEERRACFLPRPTQPFRHGPGGWRPD